MTWLSSLLLVVQVLCALAVIVLVLLQQGKGADMGAAFGSSGGGASGSLFGATGSANFLSRATAFAATVFFLATLGLAYLGNSASRAPGEPRSVMEQGPASQIPGSPANPTGSTVPAVPGNSTVPAMPGNSTVPAVPGNATVPSVPGTSAVPSAPGTSAVPPAQAPGSAPGTVPAPRQ